MVLELYNGQLKTYKFNIRTTHGSNNGKGYIKKQKCLDILCFDIEDTNAFIQEDGSVLGYEKGKPDEYWNSLKPMSLVYIWQFSVNDTVYYGRDLWDFRKLLDDLPKVELQIFIHNLNHEYAHLINIMETDTVFARSPHSPMKCTFKEYPLITFRCSYMMTNLSLKNWGLQVGLNKLDTLDYDGQLRTPLTPIEEKELAYCETDVLIMYKGILKELDIYGDVFSIPLTSTGKVRNICKERLFSDKGYMYWIKRLVPTVEEYQLLLSCFQGGYCHCSRYHVNNTIDKNYMQMFNIDSDIVSHWDFSSSYPTVLFFKYPVSRFMKRDKHDIVTNSKTRDKYSFIYRLRFTNLKSINPHTYISVSKSDINGEVINDNGRVLNCYGTLVINVTDADLDIIKWLYKWDKLEVLDSWYSYKDYLPRNFLNYVLELYSDKTTLKGIPEKADFYQLQKGRLNSLYGMCVTSLIPDDCTLDGDEWVIKSPSIEEVKKTLSTMADTKKASEKYFLNFAWGVFCTAYARKNLFKCALGIDDNGTHHAGTNNGYNCVYFDTDSIFTMGVPNYDWYNNEVTEKLRLCCKARALDFEKTQPLDIKGKCHPLGVFDREDDIKTFKCLHAKCYLEQRTDSKYYMTISGINKSAVNCLGEKPFDNFCDGFVFDKDSEHTHKLLATYCLDQPKVVFPDGYISRFRYGKNLRPIGYAISQTDEYKRLIENCQLTIDDFTDEQIQTFRNGVV